MSNSKHDKVLKLINQVLPVIHHEGEPENLRDKIMALFEKKKKVADECYQDFVEIWCEAYPIIGFKDGKVSGQCINEMIAKTRTVMKSRDKADTRDAVNNSFRYVIEYVKRENHFIHNKPLTVWNSWYLPVIQEIHAGKKIKINPASSQRFGKYSHLTQ